MGSDYSDGASVDGRGGCDYAAQAGSGISSREGVIRTHNIGK